MIKEGFKLDGAVYEKLSYGNNLPAIKPNDAPEYIPIWNDDEVIIIRNALSYGLRIFREHLPLMTEH